jgi:hypothetical protein
MLFVAAGFAGAQDETAEGTRQLYYLATPAKDAVPPLPQTGGPPPAAHATAGALHLGIRYNVVLIGQDHQAHPVPSDHMFKVGDCFAIDLQANRSGYLYVLARQSSGSWTPLPDMPGQRDALPQGKKVRIPSGACFEVHNPPGTETLFVVLSRDPRDFFELYQSVKSSEGSPGNPRKSGAGETQMASTDKLNAAVEHLDEKFGQSRDISIARINDSTRSDEPAGAVYVVNTSKKPSTSLVTKIQVRHN